jgi:UPF0755 protein
MKKLRLLAALVLLALGFAGYRLLSTYGAFPGDVFVDIPRGSSSRAIARLLASSGVVRSEWDFLLARAVRRGRVLQAGEYRFQKAASPIEVFDRIARGDVFYYVLTVPEGWNMFDIATAVEHLGLIQSADFLAAARKSTLIRDLDAKAPSLEGYLFPNTYRLNRSTTAEGLCRIMTAGFREAWASLKTSADVHETVTLASLVEKEGKLAAERPEIAAVFRNRLRIGMKLDCDPTTIYAALLAGRYRGTIYRSDLDSSDPYNTYRHPGLPPGPIANPGIESMRAALHPADSDTLYFVLKPDASGAHEFSSNIAAHEAATARYRRGRAK